MSVVLYHDLILSPKRDNIKLKYRAILHKETVRSLTVSVWVDNHAKFKEDIRALEASIHTINVYMNVGRYISRLNIISEEGNIISRNRTILHKETVRSLTVSVWVDNHTRFKEDIRALEASVHTINVYMNVGRFIFQNVISNKE